MGQVVLVTGPSRSGKSEWAEHLATQSGIGVTYVATASIAADDLEWQARILQHQQRRPRDWLTLQVPVHLIDPLRTLTAQDCLLIDSLGTWLANLLDLEESAWITTETAFLTCLAQCPGMVILVAEEVGWGLVPSYPLGRVFRDRLGSLVRKVAAIADPVYLVTAGQVLNLSQLGSPLPLPPHHQS
ncbi:adenosylcobinamide kinase [Neosynechococcus sphagnicola sy1]|uniref:Adenosylcobinamide kinase n=2 Tax=Neosynechococcus TaxID=1501143 RepID=A0A098TMZ0_9CYAN|nr:adenosylcobinamide kinase [Neosynechococcus sphagnicola sy1]